MMSTARANLSVGPNILHAVSELPHIELTELSDETAAGQGIRAG